MISGINLVTWYSFTVHTAVCVYLPLAREHGVISFFLFLKGTKSVASFFIAVSHIESKKIIIMASFK